MSRTFSLLIVAVASFALGAGCMYLIKRQPKKPASDGWISVSEKEDPIGYSLDYPIGISPTPKASGITGKAKFLTRDDGNHLGFLLKIPN